VDKATQGIRERAAEWVIHFHEESLAQADTPAFVAWLRASPVHIREYLRSEAAWFALENIDPQKRLDIAALLDDTAGAVVPISAAPQFPPSREAVRDTGSVAAVVAQSRARWWSLAAAVLLAVVLPAAYLAGLFGRDVAYMTGLGEQRTVVLTDGSLLELNTATAVEVRYTRTRRDIDILQGEAFFIVKQDAARPFRVSSNGVEVKAVGTQFNVYLHDGQTVVTVLEGKVEVQRIAAGASQAGGLQAPFRLEVGNQAVISADRQSITRDDAAMARAPAWHENKLIFADEPLLNVVAEINRYNVKQLVVADPALASRRISGVFDVHDPEVIVRFLARSAGVTVQEDSGNAWVLAPAGSGYSQTSSD
jgi:transmembrane sensor